MYIPSGEISIVSIFIFLVILPKHHHQSMLPVEHRPGITIDNHLGYHDGSYRYFFSQLYSDIVSGNFIDSLPDDEKSRLEKGFEYYHFGTVQYATLLLRVLGLTYKEISAISGTSVHTVKNNLSFVKEKIANEGQTINQVYPSDKPLLTKIDLLNISWGTLLPFSIIAQIPEAHRFHFVDRLNEKEKYILQLLSQGWIYREIAYQSGIGYKYLKNWMIPTIRKKLNCSSSISAAITYHIYTNANPFENQP